MRFCSNRWSTHRCRWSTFKQFTMFPLSPFFCVTFSTLFRYIPDPVQNIALFFGWSSSGVIVPIDFARLSATYSVPGFRSSVVKSPGSTIKWLNWSFLSKPASKPWNLCIVVAHAGTRGQYVTLQHVCFCLQSLFIIVMGTCCTCVERCLGECKKIWIFSKLEKIQGERTKFRIFSKIVKIQNIFLVAALTWKLNWK